MANTESECKNERACCDCICGACHNKAALSLHYRTHGSKCIEVEEKGICSIRYVFGRKL